ncbi:unnamed protein product [Adineta steineri]|uniref:EF-hand domain-containing protein n=1 Tax=Adineta steineri TaxID=433720 RepID=A0A815PNW5_9BILA|nr:unnamed protein product [Adineta steineri]
MASSSTQDLVVDGAELSHPITIKRGKTSRIYQVIAYPTQLTRKITNGFLDGTTTPDPKTMKRCRWHTAGIIRFHVNPETNLIYEARPDLNELEVTLECLLEESHKEELAIRAEEVYGTEFSADNFIISPFQTFMAQLTIRISGVTRTYYGILDDNKELHPMRIIFNIEDREEISEIASKLDQPRGHDIVLRYDYSLSGTSTARASLTISAEDVNKIDLEKQIFGKSQAEKLVVSRSFMDKITASITTKLRVVEDIGVGGSSFGQDLIRQEIANAMSASGFQKFSIDDIKEMQSADTDITDDLKANIINSVSSSNANSSESTGHTLDESSSAASSDILHEKSNANRNSGGQSTSSSSSLGLNATIGGFGGGFNTSDSNSQSTNFDNSNSSANKNHEQISSESSRKNEKSGSKKNSNSNSNAVQGQIKQTKNIDATIVHRSDIVKGFNISLSKFHQQLATTSIKGRLTTKADVEMQEEIEAKENAEREKQARKEEEAKIAKKKMMRQESELTPQQVDNLLHSIDGLDEDKLKVMHAEFMKLCPDGKMTKEVFSNAFRTLYPKGKVNNYCRYAFNIFDQDSTGALNFTEYVIAMHAHESDDLEDSLGLAFAVFDYDKSETIDQREILHMITSTNELLAAKIKKSTVKSYYQILKTKMASSSTQDLVVDGAELSHPITIKRGKTSRIYQVIAYPTQLTRKITNGFLDGTTTPDPKTMKKCRWHTAGIIRFHVNPETNLIYEARPDLNELEITLECLLEESHKEQLAIRAEEVYGIEFSADNFIISPFQTFMAQLTIRISGVTRTYYGILVDNKELHPMRIIFNIEDRDEILEIASKLDQPRDHDIVLRYDYSLSGTSTASASLTISAEDVNKIDLEKQIFGKSEAEKLVVSRSFMDKITANITTKLRVVEDIGVGGSSFGQDLIRQEIANAMSASGFQKFSINDIKQMQSADTDITDDLKADIINSVSSSNDDNSESTHHTLDESSSADSSDILNEKSNANRNAGGQSTSSESSWGVKASYAGIGGEFNKSNKDSQSTNFDNSNSAAKKDHEIISTESARKNENSGSKKNSNSNSNAVQGQIRQTKNIDATIVHRSDIVKGFNISLSRFHHQLATTSIKGRLTTKADVEMQEEIAAKENAEREKQARKEEEAKNAKKKMMRQESELRPQQIDDLLHAIDSLDEDKLKEMHAEFLELCPDGQMTREVFSNAFRNLYPKGKVNNYCRYAFPVFDQDSTGALNFTEYVMAMHAHESDDLEDSLGLV